MSTIKITDLTELTQLNANTSNTIFVGVDLPSGTTTKITATTIAEGLYSFNPLNVGNNSILFPGVAGQFSGNNENYLQVNLQNFTSTGTGDYVITADTGSDIEKYVDLGITNSAYDPNDPVNSLGTAIEPLSGYLYVQGASTSPNTGNLVIGTLQTATETRFISGGINANNVIIKIKPSGLELHNSGSLKFSDGTSQNTAAATNAYSILTYNLANNTNTYAYSANTYLQAYINTANSYCQAHTNAANTYIRNNYLANTSGVFNGSLNFISNITTNGTISINNSTITGNTAFFKITGAANNASQAPSNPGYTIHTTSIDGQGNRIVADAFGSVANNYASFIGRRGRGTAAIPSAVQSGDIIARFAGNGFGTTRFSQYGDGRIEIVANENFTDNSKRTKIDFYTTDTGSNTANVIATFNGNSAIFIGTIEAQKGFIFTPKVLVGAQTAITIDFSRDSVVRGTYTTGGVTITPSNFQYGKVVEVWLTNIAGNGQTITHGVAANNSSTGSTTISVASQRCAHLRYFSIDGDLANTFVSATYT